MRRVIITSLLLLSAGASTADAQIKLGGIKPKPGGISPLPSLCPMPSPAQCRDPAWWKGVCGKQHPGACDAVLEADYQAAAAGVTGTKSVMVPAELPAGGSMTTVKAKPYDASADEIWGYQTTYTGKVLNTRPAAIQLLTKWGWGPAFLLDPRAKWNGNGQRVESCEEYVWEKYHSWSLFEDQTMALGTDWPAMYDVAMRDGSPITGGHIRSRAGVATHDLAWDRTPRAKNAYHEAYGFDGTSGSLPQLDGKLVYAYDARIPGWLAGGKSWTPPAWTDDFRFWGYVAAFGRTDDERADLETKKARYKELHKERALWSSKRFTDCMYAYGKADHAAKCLTSSMSWDDIRGAFQWQIYVIDWQIEQALVEAFDLGCFDKGGPFNWCDWSPRDWLLDITESVRKMEEASYQKCVKLTGNDFSATSVIALVKTSGLPDAGVAAHDVNSSAGTLDVFLHKVETWVKGLHFPTDPKTKAPSLGDYAGDNATIGGSMFGASFWYGAGWTVSSFTAPAELWNSQGNVWASFGASATVLGQTKDVFDAAVNGWTEGENHLYLHRHLTVLGAGVYAPPDEHQQLEWNFVIPAVKREQKLIEWGTYIVVCGVPVKLSAGASGALGLNGNVNLKLRRDAAVKAIGLGATGAVEPWANVSGFAQAAVDVGFVKVGVKGSVTIIEARLPFGMSFFMGGDVSTPVTITATATLDLVLRSLDGRVVAFLDYWLDDVEATLFEWNGVEDRTRLFTATINAAPMQILKSFLEGMS